MARNGGREKDGEAKEVGDKDEGGFEGAMKPNLSTKKERQNWRTESMRASVTKSCEIEVMFSPTIFPVFLLPLLLSVIFFHNSRKTN